MIKTVFFDLDGTLLPMDQDKFVKAYMKRLAIKMVPHGYDPDLLVKTIWDGTGAMVMNKGEQTNEAVFWNAFTQVFGADAMNDLPLFEEFYRNEFQAVQQDCGFDARSAETIRAIREMGIDTLLATNPLFPAIATQSRVRWAGLEPEDFLVITTYENTCHCKPNPAFYQDILDELHLDPAECLMVGNDVSEDMVAAKTGMQVFLLTDCLINKTEENIDKFPHGSFPELLNFIKTNK